MTTDTKQCPYSVYRYGCDQIGCSSCVIFIEAKRKTNEDEPRECEPAWAHLKNVLGTKGGI